ncbi:ATP-binding protein [Pantoea sp. 18069]|uniref:ATP-binding protein n=1 Tax=Pantoea sp. 18069 TaxID=2681415 RepID=UPI00135CA8EC|nr:ATP-binding protein [Pantoea sp. 18069]
MKLWPRGMAGQLTLLILLGLLLAHVVALVLLHQNAQVLNPVARERAISRLATTWRMLEWARPEDAEQVLQALGNDSGDFWVGREPAVLPGEPTAEERRMLDALATKLPNLPPAHARVRLEIPRGGPLGVFNAELGWSVFELETALRLSDGRWLHSRQRPLAGYQWWRLLRFSLPTSTLPVLVIVLVFVWRTLRPIKALAAAAECVSRGERIAPLPLVGPRETREVSAAFNLMQDKLRRFVDDRTQLLAAISHDIRTPITSLRLRTALLEPSEQRDAMERTLTGMGEMVAQTLEFAHDAAAIEATCATGLRELVQEVLQELPPDGALRASLAAGPEVVYRARPMSLRRAVANLVDNALRHGGGARVSVLAESGGACIVVEDEGPGLEPAMLECVFEPFFQGDPARHRDGARAGGVGLGLSIARSCARAHGGDVHLANRAEGGLRASIHLP